MSEKETNTDFQEQNNLDQNKAIPEKTSNVESNDNDNPQPADNVPSKTKGAQYSEEEEVDYTKLTKNELIKQFKHLLNNQEIKDAIKQIEEIKVNFYKKHHQELEEKKQNLIKEGGAAEDFKPRHDPLEDEMKELLKRFKEKKATFYNKLQ